MAIKLKSTEDITLEGANIVIYGESGVGKTMLIKDLKNQIVISADKGLLTLKRFKIPYYEIGNMEDINEVYNIVRKSNYDHIILDSLSEIAEAVLFELKENKLSGEARKDKRGAYGDLADIFGVMIRKFRDIKGKNVIFICKMRYTYNEEGEITGYGPLIPGRVLPHGIPYLTDEVFCYMKDKRNKRYFLTEGGRRYPAKDRSGALSEKEYDPNLNDIINRVLESSKPKGKDDGRTT